MECAARAQLCSGRFSEVHFTVLFRGLIICCDKIQQGVGAYMHEWE